MPYNHNIEIPDKKPGEAYTILLHDHSRPAHDHSRPGRESRSRPSAFPLPRFPDACICCNRPSHGYRHSYCPWSGAGYARRAIELPLCPECMDHAFAPLSAPALALLPLIPGVTAMWIGLWKHSPRLQLIGTCISVLALLVFALWQLSSSHSRAHHHAGIDIDARPGRLRIATRNRELVHQVVALNRPLVRSVR